MLKRRKQLLFAGGFWSILGEAADVRRSGERNKIIAALEDHGSPMTPAEIAAATGEPGVNVRRLLMKMVGAGELHKVGGRYWIDPVPPGNTGNTGNSKSQAFEVAADFYHTPVTAVDGTGNTGNSVVGELMSNRHLCRHCGKRGETVEVSHGSANGVYLHRKCMEGWIADYDERNADN